MKSRFAIEPQPPRGRRWHPTRRPSNEELEESWIRYAYGIDPAWLAQQYSTTKYQLYAGWKSLGYKLAIARSGRTQRLRILQLVQEYRGTRTITTMGAHGLTYENVIEAALLLVRRQGVTAEDLARVLRETYEVRGPRPQGNNFTHPRKDELWNAAKGPALAPQVVAPQETVEEPPPRRRATKPSWIRRSSGPPSPAVEPGSYGS